MAQVDHREELAHPLLSVDRIDEIEVAALDRAMSGIRPSLMRCALVMMRLSGAWRKISEPDPKAFVA